MPPNKSGDGISRNLYRKNIVRRHLLDRDIAALEDRARRDTGVLRTLSSLLYDREALVRWRAIETLGKVSKIIFEADPEKIRRQLRRILWLMNDESGGLCRNGPETIGEIVCNIPALIEEYGPVLISFLNEEPFEAGTRWAVARIANIDPSIFADSISILAGSLEDPDPAIRGHSLKALAELHDISAVDKIRALKADSSVFWDYDFNRGIPVEVAVRQYALKYLERVQ